MTDANRSLASRLEAYTLQHPQEVLLVHAVIEGQTDQIVIFKGFSSSLMQPTAYDPDIPVLPAEAEVQSIDRLSGPYQPSNPQYLETDISLRQFLSRLVDLGI